jgi:hypothetical protein
MSMGHIGKGRVCPKQTPLSTQPLGGHKLSESVAIFKKQEPTLLSQKTLRMK